MNDFQKAIQLAKSLPEELLNHLATRLSVEARVSLQQLVDGKLDIEIAADFIPPSELREISSLNEVEL